MFTALHGQLVSKCAVRENDCTARVSLETVKITNQNISMILSHLDSVNGITPMTNVDTNRLPSTLKYSVKLLSVLDKSLDHLIDNEDILNRISGHRYNDKSEPIQWVLNKRVGRNRGYKIVDHVQSLRCLFTWDIERPSNKDLITSIKRKYGDYNLDISLPVFTFEKFGYLIIFFIFRCIAIIVVLIF